MMMIQCHIISSKLLFFRDWKSSEIMNNKPGMFVINIEERERNVLENVIIIRLLPNTPIEFSRLRSIITCHYILIQTVAEQNFAVVAGKRY